MLGQMTQPGKPVYGLEHSNEGLITFPGGVDLRFERFCKFRFRQITIFFFVILGTTKESSLVQLGFQEGLWRRIWRLQKLLQRLLEICRKFYFTGKDKE